MDEFVGYHNGNWLPMSQIGPDPADRGTTLGDQVTDVERTFDGKSFRMREHVHRLYKSLKYVRFDPGLTEDEMYEISEEGIRRNEHLRPEGQDMNVVHIITRGAGGPRAYGAGPPNVYIKYSLAGYDMFAPYYATGMHGVITRIRSYEPAALDPKVKHLSRLNMSLAEVEANDLDPGAWPILTDKDGNITEGIGLQRLHRHGRRDQDAHRYGDPGRHLARHGAGPGRAAGGARLRGGPAAVRRLHGRRVLLQQHAVLDTPRHLR